MLSATIHASMHPYPHPDRIAISFFPPPLVRLGSLLCLSPSSWSSHPTPPPQIPIFCLTANAWCAPDAYLRMYVPIALTLYILHKLRRGGGGGGDESCYVSMGMLRTTGVGAVVVTR